MHKKSRSHWLEVNHTVLRYKIDTEKSPDIVMLHEMGGTLESWDDLREAMPAHHSVLAFDQRGAGLSLKETKALKLATLTNDLKHLLDAVGTTSPVTLVGCAVGAAIALAFAADYPDCVHAVIALAPALGVPAARRSAVYQRADELERLGSGHGLDARLAAPYPPVLRTDPSRFNELRARRQCADGSHIAAMLRLLAELDVIESKLPQVRCPVLVLSGLHDGDRPPALVEESTCGIALRTLKVLETGHFMAWNSPQLVAHEITEFLKEIKEKNNA